MRKPDKQGDLARVIYLDYAATTPPDSRVMSVMQQELANVYGNASSLYSVGRTARSHVEKARRQVASLLGALPSDIFFTSGGSESDNAALKGMAFARREKGMPCGIVTSAIEHPAILRTCEWLEKQGFPVTYLPVDRVGRVSPDDLEAVLSAGFTARMETGIVSIMMANNEVGTIEPVRELAAIAHDHGAVFHTDAVQAVGHLPIDAPALGIDALSLSGHKLYGPKGIGVLYLRRGVVMDPLIHGGQQERGLRAGTENVPAITGLGCAAEIAQKELAGESEQLRQLKRILWDEISAIPGAFRNSPSDDATSLAGTLNFGIEGIRRDTLLIRLDLAGFAVSAGSACSAGSLEPSHVLSAMGIPEDRAQSSLRVTLGRFTTEKDIHAFAEELRRAVAAVKRA
ncbi:MAG: cysteine desulfurase family protein [Selenomonas sp.]